MQLRFCDEHNLLLEMHWYNDNKYNQHLKIVLIPKHKSSDGINFQLCIGVSEINVFLLGTRFA